MIYKFFAVYKQNVISEDFVPWWCLLLFSEVTCMLKMATNINYVGSSWLCVVNNNFIRH